MFGIPNPLDLASDWFSDGASDVWKKLIDTALERPELVVIPVVIASTALVLLAGSPAYSAAYAATAGAKDAVNDEEFGYVITGGIL